MVNCCICLDEDQINYTQEQVKTICKHPVCIECYKLLIEKTDIDSCEKSKCPLCRAYIYSVTVDIDKAIFSINNIKYECIVDIAKEIVDDIIFDDDEMYIIRYIDEVYVHNTKKQEINKYKYLNQLKNTKQKIKNIKSYKIRR